MILIVAVGIKDITIYTLNLSTLSLEHHLDCQLASPQGASYLDYSGIVKHNKEQYSLLVGQQQHLELFRIKMEFEARPVASASGLIGSGEDLSQNQTKGVKNKDLRTSNNGFGSYVDNVAKNNEPPGFNPSGYVGNPRRTSHDKKRFLPGSAIEPDSPYLRFRSPSKKLIDYRKSLTENPDSPLIKSSEETPEPSLKSGRDPSIGHSNSANKASRVADFSHRERSPRVSTSREAKPSRFSQQRLPDEFASDNQESRQKYLRDRSGKAEVESQRASSKQIVDINQAISEFSEESRNESSVLEQKNNKQDDSQSDVPALDGKIHVLRSIHSINRGFSNSLLNPRLFNPPPSPKGGRVAELAQMEEFTLRKDSFKIHPQLAEESGRRPSNQQHNLILPEPKSLSGLQKRRKDTFEGCPEIYLERPPFNSEEEPHQKVQDPISKFLSQRQRSNSAGSNKVKQDLQLDIPMRREPILKQNLTSEDQSTRQIQAPTTDLQVPPRSPVTSSLSGGVADSRRSRGAPDPIPPFDRQPSSLSDISSHT